MASTLQLSKQKRNETNEQNTTKGKSAAYSEIIT